MWHGINVLYAAPAADLDTDVHVLSGEVLAVNASFIENAPGIEEAFDDDQQEPDVAVADRTGFFTEVRVPAASDRAELSSVLSAIAPNPTPQFLKK
ncbi:MAG: hypothetical protein WD738_12365 [Pirellulales bacterium]